MSTPGGKRVSRTSTRQKICRPELTKVERSGESQGNTEAGRAGGEDAVGLRVEF